MVFLARLTTAQAILPPSFPFLLPSSSEWLWARCLASWWYRSQPTGLTFGALNFRFWKMEVETANKLRLRSKTSVSFFAWDVLVFIGLGSDSGLSGPRGLILVALAHFTNPPWLPWRNESIFLSSWGLGSLCGLWSGLCYQNVNLCQQDYCSKSSV